MGEEELSFETAPELFEALQNPNAIERRPVLAWVATHPGAAIALGEVEGRDVVDLLIVLVDRGQPYGYWQDLAITIGAFDAPKVTHFFLEMLSEAREPVEAEDAANALERRDRPGMRDRLVGVLLGDDSDRAAATARLLAAEEGLPEAAAVRVAVLEERDPPPLSEAVADAWVKELGGPFAPAARDALEAQGPAALRALAQRWDSLAEDDRAWLLEWAGRKDAGQASALMERVLESGSDQLALTSLQIAARLPGGSVDPGILGRWAQHDDAEIRAAAIEAGAAADPEHLLNDPGSAPALVAAAIHRIAEQRGVAAAGTIAARLGDEQQEVRAAAREAIVGLGPEAVEPLRPLVKSEDPETRAGAVRALLDLGDDEWLERELLD